MSVVFRDRPFGTAPASSPHLTSGRRPPCSRVASHARAQFYFDRLMPTEEWISRVECVSADDVGEEAQRLFDGRVLSLAVVGNVGRLPVSVPDLAGAL